MRFEQLQYLAAVTQHGSLRRASERLHMSQPALSEALRKLGKELGVTLLDRRRSGARISRRGRELMGPMVEVLEAVERLKVAAGDQTTTAREVRVGTVSAATSTLLVPAVRDLRRRHPGTTVEVTNTVQASIHEGLLEGTLDLGLVNLLDGDLTPPEMSDTALVHGRPVVVLPAGHPLTEGDAVTVQQLRGEQLVAMRSGYLMHRFTHRLFGHDMPPVSYSTDGAELGKVMVAEGLGVTVLPDFSVAGDVLERAGLITHRPISDDDTQVTLVVRHRLGAHAPAAVRDLQVALVRRARASDWSPGHVQPVDAPGRDVLVGAVTSDRRGAEGDVGHEADLRAWVEASRTPLRRTAYLLCADWHLADDLVQDTLTRLYAVWPRVARSGDPTAYARKILLRRFLDHRRRPSRRETSQADPPDPGAVSSWPESGERTVLLAALRRVPPGQRAVLMLRYWEDLSIEQTAELLGRSTGHVKSQASRGLVTLRTALADLEPATTTPQEDR